jgi:hypothetical protein
MKVEIVETVTGNSDPGPCLRVPRVGVTSPTHHYQRPVTMALPRDGERLSGCRLRRSQDEDGPNRVQTIFRRIAHELKFTTRDEISVLVAEAECARWLHTGRGFSGAKPGEPWPQSGHSAPAPGELAVDLGVIFGRSEASCPALGSSVYLKCLAMNAAKVMSGTGNSGSTGA